MAQSNADVIDSSMVPDTVVSVRDLFGIDLDLRFLPMSPQNMFLSVMRIIDLIKTLR